MTQSIFDTSFIVEALKPYQSTDFDGSMIVKISCTKGQSIEKNRVDKKGEWQIITCSISNDYLLEVYLKKSSQIYGLWPAKRFEIESEKSLDISEIDLQNYLVKSGDTNPIHQGEKPIIPGILLLEKVNSFLGLMYHSFEIKFLQPVFLDQKLELKQPKTNQIDAFTINGKVFELTFVV